MGVGVGVGALFEEFADAVEGVAAGEHGPDGGVGAAPCDAIVDGLRTGGEAEDGAAIEEDLAGEFLSERAAAGGDHPVAAIAQGEGGVAFHGAEHGLSILAEDAVNGLAGAADDFLINVGGIAAGHARDETTDMAFAGGHEAYEDDVVGGHWGSEREHEPNHKIYDDYCRSRGFKSLISPLAREAIRYSIGKPLDRAPSPSEILQSLSS